MNRYQHDNLGITSAKERALGLYNGKPYRTKAREKAFKSARGSWVSNAPRSYHPVPRP